MSGTSVRDQEALLRAATTFLRRSLKRYQESELAFAILHAVTATELALKTRLARIHPNLIYESIDRRPLPRRTVRLSDLPKRLTNLGVPVREEDASLILNVAGWRNEIVHHTPTFERKDAQQKLGSLYDFLIGFLRTELGQNARDLVPQGLYRLMNGLVDEWQKVINEAKRSARSEGNVSIGDKCPSCDVKGVSCRREDESAFCHLCRIELTYGRCEGCGRRGFWTDPQVAYGHDYCDYCIDAAGEQWVQLQVDIQRGK